MKFIVTNTGEWCSPHTWHSAVERLPGWRREYGQLGAIEEPYASIFGDMVAIGQSVRTSGNMVYQVVGR